MLSFTQQALLQSYRESVIQQRQDKLQKRITQALQEAEDEVFKYHLINMIMSVHYTDQAV